VEIVVKAFHTPRRYKTPSTYLSDVKNNEENMGRRREKVEFEIIGITHLGNS
jgi:hypothetical protein